ncbi:helix-turn-helix domain-containing protein [Actinomadura barringtoniae]|uniref:Helix-turn-helix domain-containing protein n=1 Tax=Actinomadura barringtoniae TaxID=1427535 RepID=A0A939T9I3_9ACTN|nr:helix-turn-helix transcriptional regulator [Actinomadura barringtoniae]MBO2451417.1 helix-turn-helix domain-containing protein [Actinomadura barringtoniae]
MGMPSGPGPVVQRAILSSELQRLRREGGQTQDQVAAVLDWSVSKLIRIEGGTVGVTTTDLQALLRLYGMDDGDPHVNRLTGIARDTRQRGWWALYRKDVNPDYLEYIGYEAGATTIRNCAPLQIPGLLQTEDYANALTVEFVTEPGQRDVVVEVRMQRQETILEKSNPPEIYIILDEGALRRRVGGQRDPDIMPEQLRHILDMAARPNITIEVIPFSQGAHFGVMGEFTLLEFKDSRLEDVLFLENARASDLTITDRDSRITDYKVAFENLRQLVLPPEETDALIEGIIRSML